MQSKSSRGVQQEDVWQAADALLEAGLRPTIERVRQHLGRGSPNTVSPMLETWFAGLGKRLGMTGDQIGEGQVPPAAAQAMAKLWNAALLAARKEAEATLTQEREALAGAHAALTKRESGMALHEQALAQRQDVVDELLRVEREKNVGVEARLEAAQDQLRQRDGIVIELRKALSTAHEQLQAARNHGDEQTKRHTVEREKWEERTAGNERRLLSEIDRERQAAKQANAAVEHANALLQTTRNSVESRNDALTQRLQASEVELGAARQALTSTELRCTELVGLLQEQRAINGATLEKLNQTLVTMTTKRAPAKRKTAAVSIGK